MSLKHNISYIEKIVPDAYHGTELGKAHKIVKEKKFISGRGKELYLGDGVYFYESSKWLAIEWCKRRFPDSEHAVIRAAINLGKCLDLHNPEYRFLLKKVALQLKTKGFKNITDSLVISFYEKHIERFDTVRWTHFSISDKYHKLFDNSKLYDFCQLIICVKNQRAILSMELA